jgi:hypothetical protein
VVSADSASGRTTEQVTSHFANAIEAAIERKTTASAA